ncbi:MAG: hypothetical protein LBH94_03120, partial [Deltaproteobacteria bacterium]|nr:hypothetical protein [Deltaproteobacteria bacterium]
RDVHVLEGPDYWVTWAEQYYNAPNLSVEGVRRLYWQRDGKGEFRIVGMEWLPQNLGIRADLHKGTLAKTSGVLSDAAMPPDADEALPVGVSEAAQTKPDDGTAPERQTLAASQPMQAAKAPPATALQVQPKASEPPATASLTSPRAAGPSDKEIALLLQNRMNEWLQALKNRSPEIFAFYDPNLYGRQVGDKQSFRAFKAEHERLFRNISWLHVYFRPVTAEKQGELWVTSSALFTRDTYGSEEGIRRLYWQKSPDGRFRIVGSNWTPQSDPAIQSDYLENITPQVRAMIEAWRQAWEKGRLDGYAEFYLPQARQGARAGSGIFRHKTLVWAKAGPEKVELSGMRIQLEKGGLRVDMEQVYRDTAGYQDKGVKTLILVPQNDTWRIAAEDWAPQPAPQS